MNAGETDVKVSNGVATVTTANKHLTFKVKNNPCWVALKHRSEPFLWPLT